MNDLQNISATRSYRTEAEASARLRELEAKYDLFRYTVDGYSAWRLLRFGAAMSLQFLPFQDQDFESKWRRLGKLLFQSILDMPALLFPKRARYVVMTCSSALNEKDAVCWKDIYFDDLLKEIGNCYKIESLNNPAFFYRRKAALIPVAITTAAIDLLSAILSRVFCPAGISQVVSRLAADLKNEPDLHYLSSCIIKKILCPFYWTKRIYKWLLMLIRPDFILFEDTGSFEIRSAAKELGIKAVEFQHGILSRNHPEILPGLALKYKSTLIVEDKLFLYGNFWKREIESNGFYDQELCVVGNIRIDRYRRIRATYKAKNRDDATCNIVLTTQGFAGKQLINFVSQFINLAEGQLNYQLYIKLHPIYDRDRSKYDTVFAPNDRVKVISGTDEPSTFELLTRADLHLSISSACHYDALGLGVPTVILALPNHEIVLHLVDSGHASLAQTPKDLVDIVTKWRDISVLPEVSEFYFQPDALVNMKRELGLFVMGMPTTKAVKYQICTRCVMDTTDPDIVFDDKGVCNHCHENDQSIAQGLFTGDEGKRKLAEIVHGIKENGKNKEYDCIIGVSGGVDSSFVAYKMKELGLRPLAVHLDNGWNSELAVKNIEQIFNHLKIPLYTHVIVWEEFKDLQLAFLKASTPDSEIPTDHAIIALMIKMAKKYKVPVIHGGNIKTESHIPPAWSQGHLDWRYIKSVHKRFGKVKLETFPHFHIWTFLLYYKSGNWINLLDYLDYNKEAAKKFLLDGLCWKDYGAKQHESIYTRFYQGYILPKKFGYDKRKAHLSSLICAGEIIRETALEELKKEPYPIEMQNEDKEYVIKKFNLTAKEFEDIMNQPHKSCNDYPNYQFLLNNFMYKQLRLIYRQFKKST